MMHSVILPDIPLPFETALGLVIDFLCQYGSGDLVPHEYQTMAAVKPQHFGCIQKRPARFPMTGIIAVLE